MFCSKCGVSNQDDARFCKVCGAKLMWENNKTQKNEQEQSKGKNKTKKRVFSLIIVLCAVVFTIVIGIFVWGYSTGKIDLQIGNKKAIEAIIDDANGLAESLDYDAAIAKLQAGIEEYPDSEELRIALENHRQSLVAHKKAEALEEARELADRGDFKAAMKTIDVARNIYGEASEYVVAYNSYYRADSLLLATEYADEQNYLEAYELIEETIRTVGVDEELQSLLLEYQTSYIDLIIADATAFLKEKDIEGAESTVRIALKKFPDNDKLSAKLEEIILLKPVSLSSAILVDSNAWSVNEGDPTDNFGNTHYSDYTSVIYNSNSWFGENGYYAEYRVYGKYTTLTGTVSNYQTIEGGTLKIYTDGVLLRSYNVDKKTDPINFALDISGTDYIKFEVDLLWSSGIILSDVYLSNLEMSEMENIDESTDSVTE